jgi:hypothetical protein
MRQYGDLALRDVKKSGADKPTDAERSRIRNVTKENLGRGFGITGVHIPAKEEN